MLGDTPGTTLPHQLPVMMTVPPPHVAIPPPPLLNVRRHPIATPPGGGRRRVRTPVEEYPFLGKSCTHVHGTILHGEPVIPSPGGAGFRGVPCAVHSPPVAPGSDGVLSVASLILRNLSFPRVTLRPSIRSCLSRSLALCSLTMDICLWGGVVSMDGS